MMNIFLSKLCVISAGRSLCSLAVQSQLFGTVFNVSLIRCWL